MRKNWKLARTKVFEAICNDIEACKKHSRSMIFVDEPEIGKTVAAKHCAASMTNAYYLDCSQAKTRIIFNRALAKAVGVTVTGPTWELKEAIKERLLQKREPIVILDEFGDVSHEVFLELKEYWNATEGECAWFLIGADGLRNKMQGGIRYGKAGMRELFSRLSGRYMSIVPKDKAERTQFHKELLNDVLMHNVKDQGAIPGLVNRCLASDAAGEIAGLRRAATLVSLIEQ